MNQIIIAIIGSGALTAIITNVFTLIKERKNQSHGVAEGVQLLLYDRIKYLSKSYIKDGQISPEDLEDITRMWSCYHDDLEGNGYLDSLMGAVKKLPLA